MTARDFCRLQMGRAYGCDYLVVAVGPRYVELEDERADRYVLSHGEFRTLVERGFLRPRGRAPAATTLPS